jgi:proteasome lid subunit RPN8/RPN11
MAISLGKTGTSDSVDAEYFNWESTDRRFMVHMHLDAMDGLIRDVTENSAGLPVEVGGILLGQVGRGERPVVWIERYQRVEIDHRSGPRFVLDDADHSRFEQAARSLSEQNELSVIGYYRSHMRPGFQLEDADRDLIGRYFRDAEDLVLLLKPEAPARMLAQFFGRAPGSENFQTLGPAFPFRGRVVGPVGVAPSVVAEEDDPAERTGRTIVTPPLPQQPPPAAAQRRLVPDFQPAPEGGKSAREFFMEARPAPAPEPPPEPSFLRRRWPLLAAILLVGAAIAALVQQASRHESTPAAASSSAVRPLGLYVDPTGQSWRVSWNPVQDARDERLIIRDGQDRVDAPKQELQGGTYLYSPKGHDVTFRLEVTGSDGRVTAESFRLVTQPSAPAASASAPAAPTTPAAPPAPEPKPNFTPPSAIQRVAPVVPASIRPRIGASIPLDVRVKVDVRGRVVSAVPVKKPHGGLETFLASRAVAAARQWRFHPARQDGKPVPGAEIIHFVFDK